MMHPSTQFLDNKPLLRLALITAFIQFTHALEYMAFTPIFAFMAGDFQVPVSFSGYVSGVYTLSAVFAAALAYSWIDRVNKKIFLVINMALLGGLTLLITATDDFLPLLLLRIGAGVVGGTTMGVATSLLVNAAPPELRGRVLATVIASFSLVSIIGIPGVLFICTHYGWQMSLWSIAGLCGLSMLLAAGMIPADSRASTDKPRLLISREMLLFSGSNALVQFSPMLMIPILVPLLIQLPGMEAGQLAGVFFIGGVAGYLATQLTGRLFSRFPAPWLAGIATAVWILSLLIPALGYSYASLFMGLFLGASYSRLVTSSLVTMRYPDDSQRAGFHSLQTGMMHLMTSLAFFLSAWILPDQTITRDSLHDLLGLSALTALPFPFLMVVLQKKLARRQSEIAALAHQGG